jgi:aspartate dehydrogenase
VALSLAGIGPDRTVLEVWADPKLDRNTHEISVDADSASFKMDSATFRAKIQELAASLH